jgi:GNAT superfamily N-acetyltransferase
MILKNNILIKIAKYAISREVYNEMKEPLLIDENDVWFYETGAFACINGNRLKYLYCEPELRNNKLGTILLKQVDEYCKKENILSLKAVIPIDKEVFYLKNGWIVEAKLTNYIKIKKVYG